MEVELAHKMEKQCFTFFLNPSQRRDEEKESVKVRMLRTFSIWRLPQGEMQQQRTGLPIEVLCLAIPVAIPPLPIPIPMSQPSTHHPASPIKQSKVTPCCRELICAFSTNEATSLFNTSGIGTPWVIFITKSSSMYDPPHLCHKQHGGEEVICFGNTQVTTAAHLH